MGIVRGRISGGVAILWNKNLDSLIYVVSPGTACCTAIQFIHNDKDFVILNMYIPYECHQNEDEYLNMLAFINSFIQNNTSSSVYVIGDMNADISDRNSLFANHMAQFCQDNFILSSKVLNSEA